MSASEDPPEIENDDGPWDERVARIIILSPFVILFTIVAAIVGLIATGSIPINVSIEGSIAASAVFQQIVLPLTLAFGALLALTWLLALMKEYGINPIVWIIQRIANIARDYNPQQKDEN